MARCYVPFIGEEKNNINELLNISALLPSPTVQKVDEFETRISDTPLCTADKLPNRTKRLG
jgi:hypothetical protein